MTDTLTKPTTVAEFLDQAWGFLDHPSKWVKGAEYNADHSAHCTKGAVDRVLAIHDSTDPVLRNLHAEAMQTLTAPGGRYRSMYIPTRNDKSALTWSGLKSWWDQARETARERGGSSRRQQAAADLRRRMGFPRHLESQTVQAHESDLAISGD